MGDVYLLSTSQYREWVRIHEESMPVLRDNFLAPQQPSCLEGRVTKLEIGSLYQRCTRQLIQIYEQEQSIPKLIGTVEDLVAVLSSNQQQEVSPTPDTFGVREAARKLGCAPGFVRTLVHSGKLQHRWRGKNLKFRQADIDAYEASQTRTGADKKNKVKELSGQSDRQKIKTKHDEEEKPDSPRVFPSTKEIKKLWQ